MKHLKKLFFIFFFILMGTFLQGVPSYAMEDTITPELIPTGQMTERGEWCTYKYTEKNKIKIGDNTYPGIIIPIQQSYSGKLKVELSEYVPDQNGYIIKPLYTTTSGTVYAGLFDSKVVSLSKFQLANVNNLTLFSGKTGIKYLVFYTNTTAETVTTSVTFRCTLPCKDTYTMEEGTIYENHSLDNERMHRSAMFGKKGYALIKSNKKLSISLCSQTDSTTTDQDSIDLCKANNYQAIIPIHSPGLYDLFIDSGKLKNYSLSFSYLSGSIISPDLTITKNHPVTIATGGNNTPIYIKYKATQNGVLDLTATSLKAANLSIDCKKQTTSTAKNIASSKLVTRWDGKIKQHALLNVKKGNIYYLQIKDNGIPAKVTIRIQSLVKAKYLGQDTKTKAKSKTTLKYGKTYVGYFPYNGKNTSWFYVKDPVKIKFEGYNDSSRFYLLYRNNEKKFFYLKANGYGGKTSAITKEIQAPGYICIFPDSGQNGYYKLTVTKS